MWREATVHAVQAGPIYQSIADDLRTRIAGGLLQVGDRIASETELSASYGVARMTVRQALANLVSSGHLTRKRGKGTFVASTKAERTASRLLGFEEDTRQRGLKPGTTVLARDWREAGRETLLLLDRPAGTRVLAIDRLRTVNAEPVGINHVILLREWAERLEEADFTGSLYRIIHQGLGDEVVMADQRIEAVGASGDQPGLLNIDEGAPLLRIVRTTYTANHGLIGLTRTFYRGDRYFLSLTVNRRTQDGGLAKALANHQPQATASQEEDHE